MIDQDNNRSCYSHDELVNLIPWYITGKLTADENTAIQEHLADCESCRQEASSCQILSGSLPQPTELWKPSAAHFAGILDEVEKLETGKNPELLVKTKPNAGFFQKLCQLFAQTPRPVRWTLAAETLAFAILAAMLLPGQFNLAKTATFETLSNVETPVSSSLMLRLVLSEDMTAKELSDLLLQIKAQIRQGPSSVGAYMVEIASEHAVQGQATLLAHPKVKLALPIETNVQRP